MRPALALMTLGVLNVLLWCPPALALDPSLDVSQYAHNAWSFHNGFLNGTIYAIAQTPDGYLWLGTESGVVRFDGVRAVPLALPPGQQLPSSAVMTLLAAQDGTLWIGTLDGLASWKSGRLTQNAALAGYFVNALLEDRHGTVWAGGVGSPTGKLCAIRGGGTTCYGGDGSFGAGVASLYEDAGGSLWVGATIGLWRWNPGPPICYISKPLVPPVGLTQGDEGAGLIVAGDRVRQIVGGKVMDYPLRGAPSPLTAAHLLRDRDGGLWIGTNAHGLVHSYEGKTSLFTHNDGLSADQVLAVLEDREGTVWVATSDGLDQFRESSVVSLSVKEGLSSAATSVLAARDGSIWIGTADGLNRWKNEGVTIYRRRNYPGLPDNEIQSLFEDERGRIWVSGFHGLAVFDKETFTAVPSVPPGGVHAIAGDNHGGLWLSLRFASGGYGLVHLVNGKIVEQMPWQRVGGGPGSGLVPDPRGGVWAGLIDGGMAHFHDGEIRQLSSSKDGLGAGKVLDVGRSRDGALWAATENGLSRIANEGVATLTTANGLPCNSVHWVIEDDVSSYWLYTRCGLVRIARTDLDAWAADPKRTIQATTIDSADGIRLSAMLKGVRPQVTKSSNGKIWFVNGDAASFIDPGHIKINSLAPPVHIEQITADDKPYEAKNGMRLSARIRNLVIDYTALSFVAPEKVRFRYKLEGQNRNWHEVINERKVQYTNLAPGKYRFRVTACNNSGVWNEEGASLALVVAPAWYQTNWFRAACMAAFLAMIWGIHELRMRQLAAQLNVRLEERIRERSRIARDLHDTLLQSFQGLVFRFQAARYQLADHPEEASEALDRALVSADQALAEGRTAIQELRSGPLKESNLEQMLLATGRELASSQDGGDTAPPLRVIVEGNRRGKRAIIREEIYRIARELLRNAYRHAHARSIEAELRYDDDAFLLIVRDDGKGIDSKVLKDHGRSGHWGLPGMYERAEGIGARLDIWSEVGAGTEVRLTVPAATAYENSGNRGRFKLFRKTRIYEHRS